MAYVKVIPVGCEGRTESRYFRYLRRVYRIETFPAVKIVGELKQHKTLVDNVVALRDRLADEYGIDRSMIECWAVTDADRMPCSYQELVDYAEGHGVNLAFSDPQFESFLLQHFSPSGTYKQDELYEELTDIKRSAGYRAPYDDSTKGDLSFIEDAIDRDPDVVITAIRNAELRRHRTRKPFLTVQRLAERFVELFRGAS